MASPPKYPQGFNTQNTALTTGHAGDYAGASSTIIYTAGANGGFLDHITFAGVGSVSDNAIRLFTDDGSTKTPIPGGTIIVKALAPQATNQPPWSAVWTPPAELDLKAGEKVRAVLENNDNINVRATGQDY